MCGTGFGHNAFIFHIHFILLLQFNSKYSACIVRYSFAICIQRVKYWKFLLLPSDYVCVSASLIVAKRFSINFVNVEHDENRPKKMLNTRRNAFIFAHNAQQYHDKVIKGAQVFTSFFIKVKQSNFFQLKSSRERQTKTSIELWLFHTYVMLNSVHKLKYDDQFGCVKDEERENSQEFIEKLSIFINGSILIRQHRACTHLSQCEIGVIWHVFAHAANGSVVCCFFNSNNILLNA